MMGQDHNAPRTRVLLWSTPRSISTAFEQSVKSLNGVHAFHEPFSAAYYLGEERQSPRYAGTKPLPHHRYVDIVERLEAIYPDNTALFVKDMGYAIGGDFSLIPDGYTHSFLIRDPRRSIPSLYRILESGRAAYWTAFYPEEFGYQDLCALHRHFVDLGQFCPVVDADDLLANPQSIMKQYCDAVGLDFSDSMLSWSPDQGLTDREEWGVEWYETLSNSTGFSASAAGPLPDIDALPDHVRQTIDDVTPYYRKLHKYRLRP